MSILLQQIPKQLSDASNAAPENQSEVSSPSSLTTEELSAVVIGGFER